MAGVLSGLQRLGSLKHFKSVKLMKLNVYGSMEQKLLAYFTFNFVMRDFEQYRVRTLRSVYLEVNTS